MSYGHWAPYVCVATRKAQAARTIAGLREAGQSMAPILIEGRAIAKTFWGKSWCDNLESYRDFENRLPRGRTYVRNGSVLDLQIKPSLVTAMVMGSSLYTVSVTIASLPPTRWTTLCRDCAGGIDSLVELLQGRLSTGVMERLCRQDAGLFPTPSEITLSCSCPDYSTMCKHVAAALYGVGARLDVQPDLLFRLRSVDETEMVRRLDGGLAFAQPGAARGPVLEDDDLSALFGLDMAEADAPAMTGKDGAGLTSRVSPRRTAKTPAAGAPGSASATPKAAVKAAGAETPPAAATRAPPAASEAAIAQRSTKPSRSSGSAKSEKPIRYLTVKEALRRSGKTPRSPRRGVVIARQP